MKRFCTSDLGQRIIHSLLNAVGLAFFFLAIYLVFDAAAPVISAVKNALPFSESRLISFH